MKRFILTLISHFQHRELSKIREIESDLILGFNLAPFHFSLTLPLKHGDDPI